jgi:putative transposase
MIIADVSLVACISRGAGYELASEVVLLRKQVAMLTERSSGRRVRIRFLQRCSLAVLSRLCHWREAIVACDVCTVVTATFRVLYVSVVMAIGSRRILHTNVTASPPAEWTTRQLREAIPCTHGYRFLLHGRDSIFSKDLDRTVKRLGLRVLKSPVRAPKADAFCERLMGTLRRECLDRLIPLSENHLRRILSRWARHYNKARPHSSLGPGIPDPPPELPVPLPTHRHRLPRGSRVIVTPILGGLHHEYRLEEAA